MSLPTQTLKRLPRIKANLLRGLNYEQIGEKCGVTEKTIDRDVKVWVDSGLFEVWIKEEWLRLHAIIIHEDPVEAYRQISKLLSRMVTRKAEIKREEKIEVIERVELSVTEDEDAILSKAALILDRKVKSQRIH